MDTTHTDMHQKREQLTAEVTAKEASNRSASMRSTMSQLLDEHTSELVPDKIHIVADDPRSESAVALYLDEHGKPSAAPIDPIVISFYEYAPTAEQEAARRSKHKGLRDGVTISGALKLVEHVSDPDSEISTGQLIAIQNQMGNNSTWWPIKDYSTDDVKSVFDALELHMVYRDGIPVGIGHFDTQHLEDEKSVKIVFVALDPALHGKGMGKEVLNEMMNIGMDMGAEKLTLDTVHHRDLRSDPGSEKATAASAATVYEKAGFVLKDAQLIDPAHLPEGVTINQLNGPIEYVVNDMDKLRRETYEAFGMDADKAIAQLHSWQNEPSRLKSKVPDTIPAGTDTQMHGPALDIRQSATGR